MADNYKRYMFFLGCFLSYQCVTLLLAFLCGFSIVVYNLCLCASVIGALILFYRKDLFSRLGINKVNKDDAKKIRL